MNNIHKPTSVRLGDIKEPLQYEASRLERPISWLIVKILKEHPIVADYLKKNTKK